MSIEHPITFSGCPWLPKFFRAPERRGPPRHDAPRKAPETCALRRHAPPSIIMYLYQNKQLHIKFMQKEPAQHCAKEIVRSGSSPVRTSMSFLTKVWKHYQDSLSPIPHKFPARLRRQRRGHGRPARVWLWCGELNDEEASPCA